MWSSGRGHTHVTKSQVPCVRTARWASLVVRSLRICLAMQEAPDRLLILEDRRPQSNYAHAPHPQNSHSANTEPSTLELCEPATREATLMRSPSTVTREEPPPHCNLRKSKGSSEDPAQPINKEIILLKENYMPCSFPNAYHNRK